MQGEFTFSNVHAELKQLLDTGEYRFNMLSRVEASLCLRFCPKAKQTAGDSYVEWDEEQIRAFEQKLSLMDDREGMQEKVSELLTWNEVCILYRCINQ